MRNTQGDGIRYAQIRAFPASEQIHTKYTPKYAAGSGRSKRKHSAVASERADVTGDAHAAARAERGLEPGRRALPGERRGLGGLGRRSERGWYEHEVALSEAAILRATADGVS